MIINVETGALIICGRNFGSGDAIESALSVRGAETRDVGTGYIWVILRELKNIADLCFFHGKLTRLSLAIRGEDEPRNWDDWDEAKERDKVVLYRAWLSTHLGKSSGRKSWGSWRASYDPKSACAQMVISYD